MKHKFEGSVHSIVSSELLLRNNELLHKMINLVRRVYDDNDANSFYLDLEGSPNIVITYMMIDDEVIGLGCICESYISFGVYELFWGMIDEPYRGNGWGKMLVEDRIKWVVEHNTGEHSPKAVIVVTKSPWHLTRCGFEIIKHLNNDGEVLMYHKPNDTMK